MKTKKDTMPFVGFRLPKKYIAMLKEAAKKEDRPYGYIIRRAVIEWLEKKKDILSKGGKNE